MTSASVESMPIPPVATRIAILLAVGGAFWSNSVFAVERLDIRATSLLPKEVQAVLNELAEPTAGVLAPNQEIETAMRQHCGGSYTDAFQEQFVALNVTSGQIVLKPSSTPRVVHFPPCPKIKTRATVNVFPGDTLDTLLMRELGVDETGMVIVCQGENGGQPCNAMTAREATNARMRWAAGSSDPLAGRPTVELPFTSRWTTVVLKEGVTADHAIKKLRAIATDQPSGNALLRLAPSPELRLPRPQSSDELSNCALGPEQAATWPFDRNQVRTAMQAASHYLGMNGFAPAPTVVRIADTGVIGVNRPDGFPESILAFNSSETVPGGNKDSDKPKNGYSGDRYGIAPAGMGVVDPLQDMDAWLHGSQVSQWALGGPDFRKLVSPDELPIRLNFARLWQRAAPDVSVVDIATINQSFQARPRLASIVNLSVGGPNQVQAVLDTLLTLNGQRQIAVLAAGNDGHSLDLSPLFPASYGARAELQPSVIVVGAHGPDGHRVSLSNYGREAVHLLAPGCALVDPYDPTGEPLVGTSFAAPLVTFAAAAIRSYLSAVAQEPMGVNSIQVKARLRAATRYVGEDVAMQTRFGGVLDIPAALRMFDDVVRLPDGKLIFGRWVEPRLQTLCKDRPLPPDRILRIWVEAGTGGKPPRLLVVPLNDDGLMAEMADPPCTALSDDGIEMILEDGQRRSFRWSEIAAFIPAYDLERRRVPIPTAKAPAIITAAAQVPELATATDIAGSTGDVLRIQEALASKGFAPGPMDGILGPKTMEAIRKYQSTRGEQASGVLNAQQSRALLSGSF